MEYRIKDVELQCEDGVLKIGGYINVTERESEILYSKRRNRWFKEVMKKGVFQDAIKRAREIPLLLEHSWDKQLASTKNDSLQLREDQIGLRFDAKIEDSNIYEQVKAGLINSCSFGFRALQENIEEINEKLEKRFVNEIELLEVSLVKNPAYVGSLVESRSYEEEIKRLEENHENLEEESIEDRADDNKEDLKEKDDTDDKSQVEKTKEEKDESDSDDEASTDDEEYSKEDEKKSDETEEKDAEENRELSLDVDVKAEVKNIVDTLIEEKEIAIECAQGYEADLNAYIQDVKSESEREIDDLVETSIGISTEIIKLRLELLKLKNLKDGI